MKQAFTQGRLCSKNAARLKLVNEIIEEYQAEGYRLTLRQLYYQLVSRDIIPNQQKEYAKLSTLLKYGRMNGIVDWDAIEDRIRVPHIPYYVKDIQHAINDTVEQYRLDRQRDQTTYTEVWIEKDALSGVLRSVTDHYHVHLLVNRGYSSCSSMYDASRRFLYHARQENRYGNIFYLGDHDPSGLDMVRDIRQRLSDFGVEDQEVSVVQVALTTAQVKQYKPPPNPTKFSDPRASDYIRQFGKTCWEVDALPPKVLVALLKQTIENLIEKEKFNTLLRKEETDKTKLLKLAESINKRR